jgi:hypothetical protein
MGLITEADLVNALRAVFDVKIAPCSDRGWVVTLPWGRTVRVFETYVDLRGITNLLAGENEEDREQLQFTLMDFEVQALGEVPLIGLRGLEYWKVLLYAGAYEQPVDENQYRPFTKAHARYRCEEGATVGRSWRPFGWCIRTSDGGRIVIGLNAGREHTIEKVIGSSELMGSAIHLLYDMQGFAIVRGTKRNMVRAVMQGRAMDLKVIPEWTRNWWSAVAISWSCSTVLGWLGAFVGLAFSHGGFDRVGVGVVWGLIVACAVSMGIDWVRISGGVRGARERGQSVLGYSYSSNSQPTRRANVEDLRKRGML